jgi:hypothetical protein
MSYPASRVSAIYNVSRLDARVRHVRCEQIHELRIVKSPRQAVYNDLQTSYHSIAL